LLEKFFEQGTLSEEEMRAGIHAAVQKQSFIPLFCTSAEANVAWPVDDFISKYGSSPVDRQKVKALNASGSEAEVALTAPNGALRVQNDGGSAVR